MVNDVVLVGGGLANTLIAFRLKKLRPDLGLVIIERDACLGGNHTWSFHEHDLTTSQYGWIDPFIIKSWSMQEVRFPHHSRTLSAGYRAISSDRLHEIGMKTFGADVVFGATAVDVQASQVHLSDGRVIEGRCVIDGRGPLPDERPDPQAPPSLALGYQKFLGLEVELSAPHDQHHPIIMDATVQQWDGYRFVYTLPFSERRILIEDTYYSDTPSLDRPALTGRVHEYARQRGWTIKSIVRDEAGVLPIVLAGDMDMFWAEHSAPVPRSGLRAGLFHPTTGYSLPNAARLADTLAQESDLSSAHVAALVRSISVRQWRADGVFRLLNRMLFLAASPEERVAVLERFYRLPEPLIERFYAGHPTLADKARIITGWPPVPIGKALRCLNDHDAWAYARSAGETRAAVRLVAAAKAAQHV